MGGLEGCESGVEILLAAPGIAGNHLAKNGAERCIDPWRLNPKLEEIDCRNARLLYT